MRVTAFVAIAISFAACSPAAPHNTPTTRAARGKSTFARSNPGTSKARLSETQTAYARVAYTHDDLGRETKQSVIQRIGGTYTFESRYGYSASGEVSSAGNVLVERTVPGGDVVRYGYDAAAQRKSVHYGERPILVSETRDSAGRVVERRLGDGSTTTIDYHESTKLPRSIFAARNGATVLNIAYAYDARQNPERIEDAAAGTTTYRYDSMNQLVAATGTRGDHAYRYDSIGNLTAIDGDEMTYDGEQPHAPTAFREGSFGYDANGNRTTDLRGGDSPRDHEIRWTSDNRVAAVARDGTTVLEKAYAADRLWVKIEYGDDGSRSTTEYLPNLRVENGRLREQFDGLAERLPNGEYRFFHTDHLGSLRAITDGSGNVVAQYAYEPYGNPIVLSGTFDPAHGYNGKEHDSSVYINYGARDFDPYTARWLSPDTVDKDGLNRYAYVRNNPIRYFDANGNESGACGSWCQFNRGRADAQWDTPGIVQGTWHSYYGQRSTANTWQNGPSAWKWGYAVHQTAGAVAEIGWGVLAAIAGARSGAANTQASFNARHQANVASVRQQNATWSSDTGKKNGTLPVTHLPNAVVLGETDRGMINRVDEAARNVPGATVVAVHGAPEGGFYSGSTLIPSSLVAQHARQASGGRGPIILNTCYGACNAAELSRQLPGQPVTASQLPVENRFGQFWERLGTSAVVPTNSNAATWATWQNGAQVSSGTTVFR